VRILSRSILCTLLIFQVVACSKTPPEINSAIHAAPSQDELPPEEDIEPIEPEFTGRLPEFLDGGDLAPHDNMTLAELVDVALTNSPTTRVAWAQARAAAAGWGSSRSEYYPTIGGEIDSAAGDVRQGIFQGGQSYVAVGVEIDYLLLDFGGREARVRAAKEALIAANWSHDQAIQDVLRDIPQAYYTYLGDKALVTAARKNLEDANTTLRSTEARRESGVSTIADVLQARSSAQQAQADLASAKGNAQIAKGTLAEAVGWQANVPYDVADEPSRLPLNKMSDGVNSLVEDAKRKRPDIAVAQATVRQYEAQVEDARAQPFPTLNATGNFQYQRFQNGDARATYGGLTLKIPLFAGFSMRNALKQAQAQLDAAKAQLAAQEDTVIKQVWDAYHNFSTAKEQYRAYQALLVSASESYDVSLARYRNGAADITELLNAQNTLASARSQLIQSRMALYSQYAELLHAVGDGVGGPQRQQVAYQDDMNVEVVEEEIVEEAE
jgi:outer membrane protein